MQVIEREHIDMIVISTHGISGWRPMVFGSIAEKVVKQRAMSAAAPSLRGSGRKLMRFPSAIVKNGGRIYRVHPRNYGRTYVEIAPSNPPARPAQNIVLDRTHER